MAGHKRAEAPILCPAVAMFRFPLRVLGWRFVMYREVAFMYDKRDHADG